MMIILTGLFLVLVSLPAEGAVVRQLPRPRADHPGNIFAADEEVRVRVSGGSSADWVLCDENGRTLRQSPVQGPELALGRLPVGWYELRRGVEVASTNRVSLAVLTPLTAPTSRSSPIALDVAMAWFYPSNQMPAVASLCSLAGVNWVRDRLNWGELEPVRGQLAGPGRYDDSALAQARAGLRQLQVNHISPAWANPRRARFPLDLRDAYHFYRAIAARWRGVIEAFEPWNEPDISAFGGHTGSEIASLQKAAYLGLKSGNAKVIACQAVFALHPPAILEDFDANQAWPYFDTFNLHHYGGVDSYPGIYADFRAVSAGKPLWVTECDVPVRWSGDDRLKEPSSADLRLQAARVAQVFAAALEEGPAEVFYFLLPHYAEGQTQFGVLRPDLTPRPAYVALAAVGRMLAEARPLGRWPALDKEARGFVFRARPDGRQREVLVAWAANGSTQIELPRSPIALWDYLGRPRRSSGTKLILTAEPVFVVFPVGTTRRLNLTPPPGPAPVRSGLASPVVLQAVVPPDQVDLKLSAYRLPGAGPQTITVRAYNFGSQAATGRLQVEAPTGWTWKCPSEVQLAAGEMATLEVQVDAHGTLAEAIPQAVRLRGDFGKVGQPILSFRLVASP